MAYSKYSPMPFSSSSNLESMQVFHESHTVNSTQDEVDDPVRFARDNWAVQHANVSDSSAIIDSIDVDMIDAYPNESSTEVYVVLDTNILIHQLSMLKQSLKRIEVPGGELNVVLLIPGIVVSELDYQKNSNRGISNESRRASDWLAGEIGKGRGRVKGQAYTQTMLPTGDWRQRCGLSNDELILDCCKYFSHIKRKDVLLCTNDNNLAVQALSNAGNLFVRNAAAVIRPRNELWDAEELLERAIPQHSHTSAASMHAFGASRRRGGQNDGRNYENVIGQRSSSYPSAPHRLYTTEDAVMEVDMDSGPSQTINPAADRRDGLHRQMAMKLSQQLRKLTGKVAGLQEHRREHESMYSSDNAMYKERLPTEQDWNGSWSLRQCLKFVAKIPPPQPRSWTFGEAEASSLADFLGAPGEKGARPGREWAKHDWRRELLTVQRLGRDFKIQDLDNNSMAEYEYQVMEAFAMD